MGYKPKQIVDMIPEKFAGKDVRLWPYILTGAWFGYYGVLDDRQPTNLTGGPTDPLFIHQFAETGRAGLGMLAVEGTRRSVNQYEFPDPLDVFGENEKGELEFKIQDLMAAYKEGKEFGIQLKKESPPDKSVKGKDLPTKMIDLSDLSQQKRYLH